jgi:regulator of PEP synthase PpsR (kinase-PPPase family)
MKDGNMATKKTEPEKPVIHVLSDSTANLSRHMLTAVLTQFPPDSVRLVFHSFTRTPDQVDKAIGKLPRQALVCHALVSPELKEQVEKICKKGKVQAHDLTGGLATFLHESTGLEPRRDVNALHKIDSAYRKRIGAMEFTLNHDDGLGLDTIHEADIVLVGVSRTSKTPTSILLAQQGYRAANVSLAQGIDPPPQLLAMPKEKVVALVINPSQLALIRAHRQRTWEMRQTTYDEPRSVAKEIAWARALFQKQGWRVIDVTDQAVEETAARVIEARGPVHTAEEAAGEMPI